MNVASGQDPLSECPQQPIASCGLSGMCNGSGACGYWPDGTLCGSQSCAGETIEFADLCGSGSCVDSGSGSCCPFACASGGCGTTCNSDTNCCTTALCRVTKACQSCQTNCTHNQWCCGGDNCDVSVELPDPGDWADPNAGDGTYRSSTFGSTNQFVRDTDSYTWGAYASDRVFHFDTHSTGGVGVKLDIEVWGTFDTVLYIRTGSCGNGGTLFNSNDNGCDLANGGSCLHSLKLPANQDYYIYVDGNGNSTGDFNLKLDFTSMCGDCICDSGYGENTTNNGPECRHAGDFCGNYINMNSNWNGSKPYTWQTHSSVDHNLDGDQDDFSWFGMVAAQYAYSGYNNCSLTPVVEQGPDRQDDNDKVYRLQLANTSNVMFRVTRVGGWSPNNYPRLFIWMGDTCPGTQHINCHDGYGSNTIIWGGGGTGDASGPDSNVTVQTLGAGTYWVIVDVSLGIKVGPDTWTQNASTYDFRVTVW